MPTKEEKKKNKKISSRVYGIIYANLKIDICSLYLFWKKRKRKDICSLRHKTIRDLLINFNLLLLLLFYTR